MRIDTPLLIEEIEKRPAIWNMTISDYGDKLIRRRCWEELTKIFSPDKISEKEKKSISELIQKKWKNIRDRFARDFKYGVGKKSQYMYGPKLQFLRNSIRMRRYARSEDDVLPAARKSPLTPAEVLDSSEEASETSRTDNPVPLTPKNTSSDNLDVSKKEPKQPPGKRTRSNNRRVSLTSKNLSSPDILDESEDDPKPPPEKRSRPDNTLVSTKLIEFLERNITELQDTAKNSQDEDRLFLLSLLTNLKSIQPRFKLKAKIEMLSVLDKYSKIQAETDTADLPQILEVFQSSVL